MGATRSRVADTPALSACSCWEVLDKIRGNEVARCARDREDFERTVSFLASVPLFCRQLPRSELPKVAQSLTQRVWKPGQRLVRQGEIGQAFFLIQDGEAAVATSLAPGEPELERATLYPGDYFGGHTLMTERPNVATIIAKGPASLVTLSMSRQGFEASGLKFCLRFPKRPALYDGDQYEGDSPLKRTEATEISPEEVDFICSAIRRNGNLRALLEEASDDILRAVAAGAQRRSVPKGEMFAVAGTVGQELFIVRAGSVDAVISESTDTNRNQSAEGVLAHSTMAERLLRKEHLLQRIFTPRLLRKRQTVLAPRSVSHAPSGWDLMTTMGRRSSDAGQVCMRTITRRQKTLEVMQSHDMAMKSSPSAIRAGRQPKQGSKAAGQDSSLHIPGLRSESFPEESKDRLLRNDEGACSSLRQASLAGGESGPAGRFVTFGEGESFGELSLIYNVKQQANFIASTDSVIYAIDRRHLTTWFRGRSHRFHEYSKFLEEVYALSQLLSSERWELACKAQGLVEFRPGERVLSQGKPREEQLWYLIWSGSAAVTRAEETLAGEPKTSKLADLYRAGHFGERSLLRADLASQVTVEAGPHGVCCLTFDGATVLPILQEIFQEDNQLCPSPKMDIEEWCRGKDQGWDRQVSRGWEVGAQAAGPVWRASSKDQALGARHIEFQDLRHLDVLGCGAFGKVVLVEDPWTAQHYALKTVSKGHVQQRRAERQLKWERELLSMLDSPFIVALHKTFHDDQHVYFLLEVALGGSLIEVIHLHSEVLMEDQPHGYGAAFYVGCLTLALEHMHERRIVHRDVKPENALLDKRGYAKLCDMGCARFVLGKTNTRAGTPDYMAPEMIDFPHTHDMSVDWWSLGVLTFELLVGQSPWENEGISDPMERLLAIRRSQGEGGIRCPPHFPEQARAFVSSLLLPAQQRLGAVGGAAAVKEHEMFGSSGVDFDLLQSCRLQSPYLPEEEHAGLLASEYEDATLRLQDSIYAAYKENGDDHVWDDWDQGF